MGTPNNPVPTITFQVDLSPLMNEVVGTITNAMEVGQSPPQSGMNSSAEEANIPNLVSGWLPSFTLGNRQVTHGQTFVEYGQKAIYLRNTYGQGYAPAERAYLIIVSVA